MQKSYDDILEEQARMLEEKSKGTKNKRPPLIQRDNQHFDSADYEKKKQEEEKEKEKSKN